MMTARELDIPVRKWVPDGLAVALLFVIILPVTMLNGTYTGSMLEVSNTLGAYTEDITVGYYAAAAGMAIAYPIVPKVLAAFSSKSLLLVDLTLQFLLSLLCARSRSTDFLMILSFAIGFLKGFLMLWTIRRIKYIFSPGDVRSEFYAYFYPLVFCGGQVSMVVTALLAYHYDWKYMYYFMMGLLIIAILLVIVLLRHDRPSTGVPLRELHVREMVIVSTGLLMLIYVITYGRISDWMASDKICLYIIIAPLLIGLFLWEQFHSPHPYVSLRPLLQWKAILGYAYMVLVMLFSTSTTLLSNYMTSILGVDNTHTYTIYVWLLPGYLLGAFICFWWFRWQRWRFRFLIAGGMACFAIFFGMLYFTVSPDSTYEMLYAPLFFRGLGMMVLLIAFGLFVVEDLHPKLLIYNAFFLIVFRAALAPVVASAIYSNVLYRLQQAYMVQLSENLTACRFTLFVIALIVSGGRARHRRGYADGHRHAVCVGATAEPAPCSQAFAGVAVCGHASSLSTRLSRCLSYAWARTWCEDGGRLCRVLCRRHGVLSCFASDVFLPCFLCCLKSLGCKYVFLA